MQEIYPALWLENVTYVRICNSVRHDLCFAWEMAPAFGQHMNDFCNIDVSGTWDALKIARLLKLNQVVLLRFFVTCES